jgi:hypothetical protein
LGLTLIRGTELAQRQIYRAVYQMAEATKGRSRSKHLAGMLVAGDWGDVPDGFLTVTDEPECELLPDIPYYGHILRQAVDWESLVERHRGRCLYCGRDDRPLTIDHIHPQALGGGHAVENLAPACKPCNSSKGAQLLPAWLARRPDLSRGGIRRRWRLADRGPFPT